MHIREQNTKRRSGLSCLKGHCFFVCKQFARSLVHQPIEPNAVYAFTENLFIGIHHSMQFQCSVRLEMLFFFSFWHKKNAGCGMRTKMRRILYKYFIFLVCDRETKKAEYKPRLCDSWKRIGWEFILNNVINPISSCVLTSKTNKKQLSFRNSVLNFWLLGVAKAKQIRDVEELPMTLRLCDCRMLWMSNNVASEMVLLKRNQAKILYCRDWWGVSKKYFFVGSKLNLKMTFVKMNLFNEDP